MKLYAVRPERHAGANKQTITNVKCLCNIKVDMYFSAMLKIHMKESDKKLWEAFVSNITPIRLNKVQYRKGKRIANLTANLSDTLDLHNHTIQEAYVAFNRFVKLHKEFRSVTILVITGKSGKISTEFPLWASANKYIQSFELKNDGGAFLVKIRK